MVREMSFKRAHRSQASCARGRPYSALQRVLDRPDDILNLACGTIGLAIDLQLGVTNDLADRHFDRALDLFAGTGDTIFVHGDQIRPSRRRTRTTTSTAPAPPLGR